MAGTATPETEVPSQPLEQPSAGPDGSMSAEPKSGMLFEGDRLPVVSAGAWRISLEEFRQALARVFEWWKP